METPTRSAPEVRLSAHFKLCIDVIYSSSVVQLQLNRADKCLRCKISFILSFYVKCIFLSGLFVAKVGKHASSDVFDISINGNSIVWNEQWLNCVFSMSSDGCPDKEIIT